MMILNDRSHSLMCEIYIMTAYFNTLALPYGKCLYQYGMIGILVSFQIESLVLVLCSVSSDSPLVSVVFSLTYKEISFIFQKL
jgi:hypothetical protein